MRILTLAFAGLISGTAAQAAGDALVIGNSSYNGVQTLFQATQVSEAAEALRAQGFDVTEARDAGGQSMTESFANFVRDLEGDEGPVVVMLAGAFLHGPNGAYLLPATDGAALADSMVMVQAFPVDAALGVLAKYPGRAFLVLSESAVTADFGDFLEAGIGDVEVPAGVTLLHGPESAVSRFAASDLTKVGLPVVGAAEAAGVTVEGFAPTDLLVVRASDVPTVPAEEAPAPEAQPEPQPETQPEAPVAEAEPVVEPTEPVAEAAVEPVEPAEVADVETAEAPETSAEAEAAVETAEAMIDAQATEDAASEETAEADPVAEPEAESAEVASEEAPVEQATETPADVAEAPTEDAPAEMAEAEAGAEEAVRSEVEIAADDAAWRAARIQNSEASYQAYLIAQPDGSYANAANQRIKAIKADPYYDLRRAEDFLGLDREARREIQRDLDVLGHYTWAVDGIFGDGTRDAVRSWQKSEGLEETGYLDLKQIAAIEGAAEGQRNAAKQEDARRKQAAAAKARQAREQAAKAEAARREAAAKRQAAATAAATPPKPAGPSDSALWAEVERLGSETAVRRYLSAYPNGARASRARQMLQVIERMRGG